MHRAVYLGKKRVTKDGQNINSEKKKKGNVMMPCILCLEVLSAML